MNLYKTVLQRKVVKILQHRAMISKDSTRLFLFGTEFMI